MYSCHFKVYPIYTDINKNLSRNNTVGVHVVTILK